MAIAAPASLDSTALSRRLGELAGHERRLQLEFLLHLDEFDRRRAWAEAGYPSLWEWCLRVLHLREGAAGRRIAAMRVLRRFPALGDALGDGRLCLSTVAVLGPVLTGENCAQVVARAAFMTRADTEHLVASLQPRAAPREGLRLLSSAALPRETPPSKQEAASPANPLENSCPPAPTSGPPPHRASHPTLEPMSASTYSLRVTVDGAFKRELEQLRRSSPTRSRTATSGRCCARRSGARSRGTASARAPSSHRGSGRPPRRRRATPARSSGRRLASTSPPSCGGRCGSATAGGAPGAARTATSAGAPGRWRSTTSSRSRWAGGRRPTTAGCSAPRTTSYTRSRYSGARTWSGAGASSPGWVRSLFLAEVEEMHSLRWPA